MTHGQQSAPKAKIFDGMANFLADCGKRTPIQKPARQKRPPYLVHHATLLEEYYAVAKYECIR